MLQNEYYDEPRSFKEALSSEESESSMQIMQEEMIALNNCDTQDLVSLPKGRKTIRCRTVFKKPFGANSQSKRYKARLEVKGYSQREVVDFSQIFNPVAKLASISFLLFIVVTYDFQIEKMDVETTFLHVDLQEEIYMRQLNGFVVKGKEHLDCKLKQSLYGHKQSPRMWTQNFDSFASKLSYVRSEEDHCVCIKVIDDQILIIVLYVDDVVYWYLVIAR